MKVLSFSPPGRFPTVVTDPGRWWSVVAATGAQITQFSANAAWWQVLCSPAVQQLIEEQMSPGRRWLSRLQHCFTARDLRQSGIQAGRALHRLCQVESYESAESYFSAVAPLADHLFSLNRTQGEIRFSLQGAVVNKLNYASSAALAEYASKPTFLWALIARALQDFPAGIGFAAVRVTSAEDLLCAMIAVRLMRKREPGMHICLADHGYENFSLHPHLERLSATGALTEVFDTIIARKQEVDRVLPRLIEMVAEGRGPKGLVSANDFVAAEVHPASALPVPPPMPAFTPEPIFWTRLSARACYWSRCTFCVQNAKHGEATAPMQAEIAETLERLERLKVAGYKTFIFSDEALSPALLKHFCRGLLERGLELTWACRCKLELGHTPELFRLMREAGCYEVLFGLESISPRTQRLMGKFVAGLDEARIREIMRTASEAGLGIHINLIGGFPGDTAQELAASVDFLAAALATARNATFLLNEFALFSDSPILRDAESFGLTPIVGEGDMPTQYSYRVRPELCGEASRVQQLIPVFRRQLNLRLGWSRWRQTPGVIAALHLYFVSGHGAIFKSQPYNAFSNPLHDANGG